MVLLLTAGLLLLATALASPTLHRLPISTAMVYLSAGIAAGPSFLGWITLDPISDSAIFKTLSEVAVLVSLFVTGMKMDSAAGMYSWRPAIRLASLSMVLTIAGLAALAHWLLQLPWGLAVVLGSILAPTDPVLASDIQVQDIGDRDTLRFSLSGEAGLNDGTAFPFVMLGLGLMGLHELGDYGLTWLAKDVLWAVSAGLAIGWATGYGVGKAIGLLHGTRVHSLQMNEFIAIGVIAVACAAAQLVGGYAFLAVFIAGVTLRRGLAQAPAVPAIAQRQATSPPQTSPSPQTGDEEVATGRPQPESTANKVNTVLEFNGQLERISEFVLVGLTGVALSHVEWSWAIAGFTAASLLVVRPLIVSLTLNPASMAPVPRRLAAWFGIRGVGSIYYLAYVVQAGIHGDGARMLVSTTLAVVATSVVLHGISVTPLMARYSGKMQK